MNFIDVYPHNFSETFVDALKSSARRMAKEGFSYNEEEEECYYRKHHEANSPTCIVGGMIDDYNYSPDIEGIGVLTNEVLAAVEASINHRLNDDEALGLTILQKAHDNALKSKPSPEGFSELFINDVRELEKEPQVRKYSGFTYLIRYTPQLLRLAERVTREYDKEREARYG